MSIFDFFRGQNAFGGDNAMSAGGAQPNWQSALIGGIANAFGNNPGGPPAQTPTAPTPATRPTLPPRTDSISDIASGSMASPVGPYAGGYAGLYNVNPGIDYTNQPHPELDKYTNMLDNYPERPSPSWMRTLATGAYSWADAQKPDQVTDEIGPYGRITRTIHHGTFQPMNYDQIKHIMQDPYETRLGDYENELKARGTAAQIERQTLNDQSLAQQRASTTAKNMASIPQTWAKISQQDARVRVAAFDSETKARTEALAEALKDVPESERLRYLQEGRISVADMNNVAALERTREQQTGATQREREAQAAATGREREAQAAATGREREAQAAATARQKNKEDIGQLPTQQVTLQKLRVNRAIQEHPEWRNYFETDPNGIPQIKDPSSWMPGHPDQATYDQIRAYLAQPNTSAANTKSAPQPVPQPQQPTQQTQQPTIPTNPNNVEPGYVAIADAATGKIVGQIPDTPDSVNRLNKKYKILRPR